jgi:hypothetical protein
MERQALIKNSWCMRILIALALCLFVGDPVGLAVCHGKQVPTVNFCDLIRNSNTYDKKEVRIKALFRVGYEWEEIYCLDCYDADHRTWIKFDEDVESCTKREIIKLIGAREGTFSIVAVGEFQSSGSRYGHMGAYRYQFVVKCIEKATKLFKDGRSPNLLPKSAFRDICSKLGLKSFAARS